MDFVVCAILKTVVRTFVNQGTFKPVLVCSSQLVFAFPRSQCLFSSCDNCVFHPALYPVVPAGLFLGSEADAA